MKIVRYIFYFIFILLLCSAIFLLVRTPLRPSVVDLDINKYDVLNVNLPIIQHIKINEDKLSEVVLDITDSNLNDENFKILLLDETGETLFSQEYKNYNLSYVEIRFPLIEKSKNKELTLKVLSDDRKDVNMLMAFNGKNKNSFVDFSDSTLKYSLIFYKKNYSYFWYLFVAFTFTLTLFFSLKEEEYEK